MAYYIEKPDVGLTQIMQFVNYMIENRTKKCAINDLIPYNTDTISSDTMFFEIHEPIESSISNDTILFDVYNPIEPNTELPTYLFIKSGHGTEFEQNYNVVLLPYLLVRLETNATSYTSNKIMTPFVNYENKLNAYYNKGLFEGNHHYLHNFAIEFNKMVKNGVNIMTGVGSDNKRYFILNNPNCEDPKFIYNVE